MAALPGGDVSFCFVELPDVAALFASEGGAGEAAVRRLREVAHEVVPHLGGAVVRAEPDRAFLAFADAEAAVGAAVEIQRRLTAGSGVGARVGVHRGEAEPRGDDYVALAVHAAARVAAVAHVGQVVVSETAAVPDHRLPPGVDLRPLGRFRLRDLVEPLVLHQAVASGLRTGFPALDALPDEGHNVKPARTAFVGRTLVSREIEKRVAAGRLVTVAGPGGVGKSRVAAEIARQIAPAFADGVWLVEVGAAVDAAEVARVVADTVGVAEQPGRSPVDVVADTLAARRMLLVVDGSEQARDAVAHVVDAVLTASSDVKVLVTSRVPLGLEGEAVVRLGPLETPPADAAPGSLAGYEAVELFLERALAAGRQIELDAVSGPAVAAACRAVDGIPLAIELAAASLRSVTLVELVTSLSRGHHDAVGDLAIVGPVRKALARTAELLGEDLCVVWRRVSVFRGPFDLDRAATVAGFPPVDELDVLDGLNGLVDWSVVEPVEVGVNVRFRLLDTVRAYGWALAGAAGEGADLRDRHVRAHADRVAEQSRAGDLDGLLAEVSDARADIRVAVHHAMRDDPVMAAGMVADIAGAWEQTGGLDEVSGWASALLEQPTPPSIAPHVEARLRCSIASLAYSSVPADVDEKIADAVRSARSANQPDILATVLVLSARRADRLGRYDDVTAILDEADGVAAAGALGTRSEILRMRASIARREGGYAAAKELIEEALAAAPNAIVRRAVEVEAAQVALWSERLDDAEAHLEAALDLAESLGNEMGRASAVRMLGQLAHRRGDLAAAEARYRTAAESARRLNRMLHHAVGLQDVARVLATTGRAAEALAILTESHRIAGDKIPPAERDVMGVEQALYEMATGAYDAAAATLAAAVAESARDHAMTVFGLSLAALVEHRRGRRTAAIERLAAVAETLEANPDDPVPHRLALLPVVELLAAIGERHRADALRPYCGQVAGQPVPGARYWDWRGPLDIGDGPGPSGVRDAVAWLHERLGEPTPGT